MSTNPAADGVRTLAKSQWRRVMGHYPTGVTIVTSVDEAGSPLGMIVGTFTSVSEEPPLVGFLPRRTSYTLAQIERAGRFRASVLGAGHEDLCRAFFTAPPESRFATGDWEYDESGIPWLRDAVAWFDAAVHDIQPAGDHVFVQGLVEDMGLGSRDGGMPLLFLGGGYGSFTLPRIEFNLGDVGVRLRVASSVGDVLQDVAQRLGIGCSLSSVIRDEVVVLAAAEPGSSYVGTCFPFAAPMDPGFAAWCPAEQREAWLRNARAVSGEASDEALMEALLDLVRSSGYAISFGQTMSESFRGAIAGADDASGLQRLWSDLGRAFADYCRDPRPEVHARVIQVPVFNAAGTVELELVVGDFGRVSTARFGEILEAAFAAAEQITELIGGTPPPDYRSGGV